MLNKQRKVVVKGTVQTFIFLALIIVVFIFMIRPQTKKNKEAQRFRENLKEEIKLSQLVVYMEKSLKLKEIQL